MQEKARLRAAGYSFCPYCNTTLDLRDAQRDCSFSRCTACGKALNNRTGGRFDTTEHPRAHPAEPNIGVPSFADKRQTILRR
ncbi:MAG: hypothetical protein OXT67_11915 [Zetaproteobacteria bacterium]|nr:hypothetical protein [Zetaproteobacteria bacterium]